jgi:preprotein translocase subunit SecA
MSQTPVQSDLALWTTLRIRRRHVDQPQGMDAKAGRWITRIKKSRKGLAFLNRQADQVLLQGQQFMDLTDAQLDERILEIRSIFACRNIDDDQLIAATAAVREVARRELGEYPYKVQVMGALGMYHGQIIEMVTGEGKTLTASLGASLLGWLRRPVHVITVNDYLANRDAESRMPIYRRCGLTARGITGETEEAERRGLYRLPIVYLTQKELVADWLRDQLKLGRILDPITARWKSYGSKVGSRAADQVLIPGLYSAVIDELDAVLIDEAVTPLIIANSSGTDGQAPLYHRARELALQLTPNEDFIIEHRKRRAKLTDEGYDNLEDLLTEDDKDKAFWRSPRRRDEMVEQALTAEHCYFTGDQYHIVEDKIVIVDEYTGRFMEDRQWQHGLHQATEAKHDLEITADRDTLASLSFQRFFRMYPHLCGMTGTAAEAIPELEATYGLPVRVIPTHRPIQRKMLPDLIFRYSEDRWKAVVEEIRQMHELGRPVLVGTRSIESSERLSELLNDAGLEHEVLNAVHHEAEAEIVSRAGEYGAIMVATNMAGRGTDIKLGKGVIKAGGLHVILTERHTARRVDRQLYGRAGRQGDPGSARNIVSLEDDLLIKFSSKVSKVLRLRYANTHHPLPRWLKQVFDMAQKKAQGLSFDSRAQVLKHDEELDKSLPS